MVWRWLKMMGRLLSNVSDNETRGSIHSKGAYIKYVGWGASGFCKFFKKVLVAQETTALNLSWPSSFLRKYFMAPPINFSFFFTAYL